MNLIGTLALYMVAIEPNINKVAPLGQPESLGQVLEELLSPHPQNETNARAAHPQPAGGAGYDYGDYGDNENNLPPVYAYDYHDHEMKKANISKKQEEGLLGEMEMAGEMMGAIAHAEEEAELEREKEEILEKEGKSPFVSLGRESDNSTQCAEMMERCTGECSMMGERSIL
jgi:hypothetical protein